MCKNCECLSKLCRLNVIAYTAGWLGMIWRTVLVAFFSIIVNRLTEYDQSLYWIIFISGLTYFVISVVINLIFLYGIYIERRHFLLPYITIVALEIVVGCILASGIVLLFWSIRSIKFIIYVILMALFLVVVHLTLWLHNIFFYKELEHKATMKKKGGSVSFAERNSLDNL